MQSPRPLVASTCPPPGRRYLELLLAGDRRGADAALREAVGREGIRRTYLAVLGAAQVALGQGWLRKEINVAHHHLANQILCAHLDRLVLAAPVPEPLGKTAVVAALTGERHTFGARMVADFLRFEGFAVDFLGGDTPGADLVDFVRKKRPDLVGISVTRTENTASAREAAARLKSLREPPVVLCGGIAVQAAFGPSGLPEADGFAEDAAEAIVSARRLLGLKGAARSLEGCLTNLGRRVRRLRTARGWNQSRLAREARLDRSYVSSVENGKHNLTVSVALKLAHALEVPLASLIRNGSRSEAEGSDGGP